MHADDITDDEVRELIALLVAGANEHMSEARQRFSDDFFRNSLALILTDTDTRFGFLIKNMRVRMIEDEEASSINATAIVETTKDFLIEFLNSKDWNLKAIEGFNTYKVNVESSDGRDYVHYKNLLEFIKWINTLLEEEQ